VSAGALNGRRTTCRQCQRTVVVIDGVGIVDSELVQAVEIGGNDIIRVRRLHSELCTTYATERERAKADQIRRRGTAGAKLRK